LTCQPQNGEPVGSLAKFEVQESSLAGNDRGSRRRATLSRETVIVSAALLLSRVEGFG
jgi:hypothetical protein